MQYQYRQARSSTLNYHPIDFFRWCTCLMGKVGFFILVGLYTTTTLTLQFSVYLLKNAPKFILVSSFYVGLAVLLVVVSSFVMGSMLMALLAGVYINV